MTIESCPEARRVARLAPPAGPVRLVLDTDAANQSDDLFAIAYALASPERLRLEALYAAPFHNARSAGPGDGMKQSLQDIEWLLDRRGIQPRPPAMRGAESFLPGPAEPRPSDAARDLVERALDARAPGPLYVAAIGAPTNVASALLMEPRLIDHIVVVWLGGQPHVHPAVDDFNARQDLHAARLLFDSGVPLIQIPCAGVAELLATSAPELERYAAPTGPVGAALTARVAAESTDARTRVKILWDLAPLAWLIHPPWVSTILTPSPVLNDNLTYSRNFYRHLIRVATRCDRDPIFRDLFEKLAR